MKTKQPCLATFVSFLIALVSLVIALAWQNLNISNWKLVISLKNQMYIHNITESYRYRYHFQFHDSQLDVIHSHAACLCHLPCSTPPPLDLSGAVALAWTPWAFEIGFLSFSRLGALVATLTSHWNVNACKYINQIQSKFLQLLPKDQIHDL